MKKLFLAFLLLFSLSWSNSALAAIDMETGLVYDLPQGFDASTIDRPSATDLPVPLPASQLIRFQRDGDQSLQLIFSSASLQDWVEESQLRYIAADQTTNREVMGAFGIEIRGHTHSDLQPATMLFFPSDQQTAIVLAVNVEDLVYESFLSSLGQNQRFQDIRQEPLRSEIDFVGRTGIFQGYQKDNGERLFRPHEAINRAELLKVLVLASPGVDQDRVDRFYVDYRLGLGRDDLEAVSDRSEDSKPLLYDVSRDAWFAPYVFFAFDQEWIQGYPDGSFQPTRAVNLAELVKVVLASRYTMLDMQSEPWFRPYFTYFVGQGILDRDDDAYRFSQTDTRFYPFEQATRAHVAGFLGRLLYLDQHPEQSQFEGMGE